MTPAQIENYVDAAAAALQLPLAAAHRPGVLSYFALAASMADLVGAHPLAVTDDPAEAFVPISPGTART
ncbi:MAG: AtzG-like protein [Pseudomonadota bacterium]